MLSVNNICRTWDGQ